MIQQQNEEKGKWHTTKWYKDNWKVDPQKSHVPFKEVKNPYYPSAGAPMKLYLEDDVAQIKDTDKQKEFAKRHDTAKQAAQTRKENLIKLFADMKATNPEIPNITKRLWEIGENIRELHAGKEQCRSDGENAKADYFELGMEHCQSCERKSAEQEKLREEREQLFQRLEKEANMPKAKIQLARKYIREQSKV